MASMIRPVAASIPAPGVSGVPSVVDPPQRPRHKRTHTGFGVREIKAVEASIPEQLRNT
jgi:starch phosphorylase